MLDQAKPLHVKGLPAGPGGQQRRELKLPTGSVPDKEEEPTESALAILLKFTIYLSNTGLLEEKGKVVILTELPSHDIECEWGKSTLSHRGINSLKASKVKKKGLGKGEQCTAPSYFPGSVVSILHRIIYFIETYKIVFYFLISSYR